MHPPRAGSISSCVHVMHNDRSKEEILENALAHLREADGITSQSKHVYTSPPT
jgi:hypothetical protein